MSHSITKHGRRPLILFCPKTRSKGPALLWLEQALKGLLGRNVNWTRLKLAQTV